MILTEQNEMIARKLIGGWRPIIYVAGPMTGYVDFNYPRFNAVARSLRGVGLTVLNPVDAEEENPTPGVPQEWLWYMRRSIRMVSECDLVVLLEGWESSRGARTEFNLARDMGLPCVSAWAFADILTRCGEETVRDSLLIR